ncbi:RHS repeat-associated core domain-containing protein [Actinospica robiniae]|uniref:RHS repeat-associated core domain-containing protein n=1 Tax=Actinospica robiniae TaxID=304901 RepID=UPI0004104982|nr:RHS repeat-associated core domain-containing protein [Actinospica robiniae]
MSDQQPINIDPESLRKGAAALHQFSQSLVPMGQRMQQAGQKLRSSAAEDTSGLGKALAEGTGGVTEALGVMFKQVGRWTGGAGLRLGKHAESTEDADKAASDAFSGIHGEDEGYSGSVGRGGGGESSDGSGGTGGAGGKGIEDPGSLGHTQDQGSSNTAADDVNSCKDPIDVVSGMMFFTHTDLDLPGMLPLVLSRTFRSNYRQGRWFGRRWASSFDERAEVGAAGVHLAVADGVVLHYPLPSGDEQVLPDAGSRWPLVWDRSTDTITVTDPQTGRVRAFPPVGGTNRPLGSITDRNGYRITFVRDREGVPELVTHSAGYQVAVDSVDTRAGMRITGLRLLDGTPAVAGGAPGTQIVVFGYDPLGNLVEVFNSSGLPLVLEYDREDRITKWVDRIGTQYTYEYDSAGRVVRTGGTGSVLAGTMDYDPERRVTYSTDSLGAVTEYFYDANDRVIKEVDPLGGTTLSTWDPYGNLLTRTNALGRTVEFAYDELGNLLRATGPSGATARTEYNALCLPTRSWDADGSVFHHTYDEAGNLLASTDSMGLITAYGYGPGGRLTSITDALGNVTAVQTDRAGLITAVTGPHGPAGSLRRDAFGRPVQSVDALGASTACTWSPEGWLTSTTNADGAVETLVRDGEGNVIERVDRLGGRSVYEVAGFGLVRSSTGPDGARHAFSYDTEGRLTSVLGPSGACWTYGYDLAGNLVEETDFDGRTLRYEYNALGELARRTNGAGQSVEYAWNEAGDLLEVRDETCATRYDYDVRGLLVCAYNAESRVEYVRDARGEILRETVDGRTVLSEYDLAGNRTRRVTPSGVVSDWAVGAEGLVSACAIAGTRITFDYDARGQETSRRIGAATAMSKAYDQVGRLQSLGLWALDETTPGEPQYAGIRARAYSYRADSKLAAVHDQAAGLSTFDLDPNGRVRSVSTTGDVQQYAYDASGNLVHAEAGGRSEENAGARTYEGARLRRAGRTHYDYDGQGRVVRTVVRTLSGQNREWTYSWNARDQLVAASTPDGAQWRYTYDPLGRRIRKEQVDEAGAVLGSTVFSWDGIVLVEQACAGASGGASGADGTGGAEEITTWDYLPGTYQPVSQVEQRRLGPETGQAQYDRRFYAIATDLVGRPTELIAEDGRIGWSAGPDLWGLTSGGEPERCPLRFPGQYHDEETGWHYSLHRHYDPAAGRFVSPDPLGLSAAPNHYAYVENPATLIDPLGLKALCPFGEAKKAAADLRADAKQTGKSPPLASAAAIDSNGQVYTGYSGEPVGKIHPLLQSQMPNPSNEKWEVQNCAEFVAANKALWANSTVDKKGNVTLNVEPSGIQYSTVYTKNDAVYQPCRNCVVSLAGLSLFTPPKPRGGRR